MRRGSAGRICDRLAVEILHALDRRACRDIPEDLAAAGIRAADDPDRRAFGKYPDGAKKARGHADLGAVRDHRLLGFAATVGIEDVEREVVLAEQPGIVANLGDEGLTNAAAADCDLEPVLRRRLLRHGKREQQQQRSFDSAHHVSSRYFLPSRRAIIFSLVAQYQRQAAASAPSWHVFMARRRVRPRAEYQAPFAPPAPGLNG